MTRNYLASSFKADEFQKLALNSGLIFSNQRGLLSSGNSRGDLKGLGIIAHYEFDEPNLAITIDKKFSMAALMSDEKIFGILESFIAK